MTEDDYIARASDPGCSGASLEALWREIGSFRFPLGPTAATRIQHAIAKNPNLTQTLAKQCFGQLSPSLAENPALPLLFLQNPQLAEDAAEETLLRMTRRLDSPASLLEVLTHHSIRQVREAARLHLALYGEATEENVRTELANLPIGGKEKLMTLHAWGLVPGWLATRHKLKPAIPPTLPEPIEGCVNDAPLTEAEVAELEQWLLAARPWKPGPLSAPAERLRTLAQRTDVKAGVLRALRGEKWLHKELESNPASPLDLLLELRASAIVLARTDASHALKTAVTARVVDRTSSGGLVVVLALAHLHDDELLHESALSTRWIRRLGASLNPRLTEKDRKRLVEDATAIVRAVARDTSLRDRLMASTELGKDGRCA